MRLLVADDQPDVLEALRLLLSQYGFSLELVASPRAVLERLAAGSWDALLMDLNYSRDTTSGAEGMALVAQVRAIVRPRSAPSLSRPRRRRSSAPASTACCAAGWWRAASQPSAISGDRA